MRKILGINIFYHSFSASCTWKLNRPSKPEDVFFGQPIRQTALPCCITNIFLDFSFITNLKKSGNKNGEPPKKKKKIQTGSDDLIIPDCAVYLRNQVDKIIRQKDAFEIQAILTTLCTDQLLIPDEDMIHSLTEGKDDNSILPR